MLPRQMASGTRYEHSSGYKFRITLMRPGTKDSMGNPGSPTEFATVWASITTLDGRQLEKARQLYPEVTHKIVIRYNAGVSSDMYVLFRGRTLPILAVNDPDQRQVELHLLCAERNDGILNG